MLCSGATRKHVEQANCLLPFSRGNCVQPHRVQLTTCERMTIERLDAVSIFNDKLTFLIPHEWIEVESDENDVYQYQLPDAISGFFRVSLITADGPAEKL